MDQSIFRWLGHVERIEDNRLASKVHESEIQEPRCRGSYHKRLIDGVKEVLWKMGQNIQEMKECVQDR